MPDEAQPLSAAQPDPKADQAAPGTGTPQNKPAETGPTPAAAGVFTSNRIQAAPVHWSRRALAAGRVSAVVLNSGGANACT
uniref:bifunctional ornithine acetyltransferase/N-acetylglutamate synthase n=1 Tax=Streptomyces sp. MSC1_001 TaxID=2909263 RepID=UPI0027E3B374